MDVSHLNTSNITKMSSMFYDCTKITSINVSKFDTSIITKVSILQYMFKQCDSLKRIKCKQVFKDWY